MSARDTPRFDKLLVLDLDETLIHANAPEVLCAPAETMVGPYGLLRRPHLHEFLAQAFDWFEVGIWTASSRGYAEQVVDWLGVRPRLRFLWARERCTPWLDAETMDRVRLKPLQKIVRSLKVDRRKVLFVDDTPEKIRRSYGN